MQKSKFDRMKRTGVWLDKEKAIIVTLYNGDMSTNTILSHVKNFHVHSGSGTRLKGGPQDVVQDSKYLEREKHQLKKYFNNIASEIKDDDAIVLFGPAEIKDQFNKELRTSYKDLSAKIKDVVKTDKMTKRQVRSWVKIFFESTN
ncbi:hypothetical protein GCM10023314_12160 [Algibacter agarivorans]|uniref:Protein required for attachment to host cells n=1 Tax=Algibacter agarivorans TaxID=1109741 RepID=A0ABP9GFC3_9FLAO